MYKSWSGVRKHLEHEIISKPLENRVRYDCTTYVGMDGCDVVRLYIDNKEIKRFSHETVCSYFHKNNLTINNGIEGFWTNYWITLDEIHITKRTEYTDYEFFRLWRYTTSKTYK